MLRRAVCVGALLFPLPAMADVIVGGDTGEVSPADPATWTSSNTAWIGWHWGKTGTLTLGSGQLTSGNGQIGASGTGTVTITGATSQWTNSNYLYIGNSGYGTLAIQYGGKVVSGGQGILGYSGGDGTVRVLGNGTTWTNNDVVQVGYSGTGRLEITLGGKVSDTQGQLGFGNGSSGSVTVDGPGSTWNNSSGLVVGSSGRGTLSIKNGAQVTSVWANIASSFSTGSGTVYVSGTGSTWTNNTDLLVGDGGTASLYPYSGGTVNTGGLITSLSSLQGNGTINTHGLTSNLSLVFDATHSAEQTFTFGSGGKLNLSQDSSGSLGVGYKGNSTLRIADGVTISSYYGYVGYSAGNTGTATITGPGSTWSNSLSLTVGRGSSGTGILNIQDGGRVTASSLTISNAASTVNLHVDGDNVIVLGDSYNTGRVSNAGKINLYAGAFLPSGSYYPISEARGRTMTWSGSGSYNGYGGAWDPATKAFVVSDATAVPAGISQPLTSGQRLTITSPAGAQVGASFGPLGEGFTFAATPMTAAELSALLPSTTDPVLQAWDFTTNLSGQTVLLSFKLGEGASDMQVWHYANSTWSAFTPGDLTYRDGVASFSVSGFSGYAITGTGIVPEPAICGMLLLCSTSLLRRQRSRMR